MWQSTNIKKENILKLSATRRILIQTSISAIPVMFSRNVRENGDLKNMIYKIRGHKSSFLLLISSAKLLTIFNGKHSISREKTYTFAEKVINLNCKDI